MSKRKSRNKNRKKKDEEVRTETHAELQGSILSIVEHVDVAEQLSIRKLYLLFSFVNIFGFIVTLLAIFGAISATQSGQSAEVSQDMINVILVLLCLVTLVKYYFARNIEKIGKKEIKSGAEFKYAREQLEKLIPIQLLSLTLSISLPLYNTGVPNKIADLLADQLPTVGTEVIKVLSIALTFLTSGILGTIVISVFSNLLTDALKNLFGKAFRRIKTNQTKHTEHTV